MSLPYSNTSTGEKAVHEIQKFLRGFGSTSFGTMMDDEKGLLMIQFVYRGQNVSVPGNFKGYAQMWLKENPYNKNRRCTLVEHERKALEIASVAVYSILRDWIKGQITAVETGILSFEGAFLGQILLASGKTVLETAVEAKMIKLTAIDAPKR